jgi:hypothetical protein
MLRVIHAVGACLLLVLGCGGDRADESTRTADPPSARCGRDGARQLSGVMPEIEARQEDFADCYLQALAISSTYHGSMNLIFTVERVGIVSDVSVSDQAFEPSNPSLDRKFAACVVAIAETVVVPRPSDVTTLYCHPLIFGVQG